MPSHVSAPPAPAAADAPTHAPHRPETIIILDFGSQYSMLIARRVRECNVYCELKPWNAPRPEIEALNPRGFILSGGPASVYDTDAPLIPDWILTAGLPILGICYGMQALAFQLGGAVAPGHAREYGPATIRCAGDTPIFSGLPGELPVWMSHGDRITALPPGFTSLAGSDNSPIAAMETKRSPCPVA